MEGGASSFQGQKISLSVDENGSEVLEMNAVPSPPESGESQLINTTNSTQELTNTINSTEELTKATNSAQEILTYVCGSS